MLEAALKARLPLIEATTDDLMNLPRVLHALSGQKVVEMTNGTVISGNLYYSTDPKWDTPAMYERFLNTETTLVLVNLAEPSQYAFRVGPIPVPEALLEAELKQLLADPAMVPTLLPGLRGLSLKLVREVIMLTEARHGFLTAAEVRRTRAMVAPSAQGLTLMDTTLDFYEWPKALKDWLALNTPYFTHPAHARLTPRGLLFDGPPGVGKSTAAKAIAQAFNVPLYRLDIAATLDRYIGVSESRLAQSLALIDRESPCVLLIDEAEKIFAAKDGESGVTTRMLSQLLWWLAEHQSRVFTVMTTNSLEHVPPELYRPGRVDQVMELHPLVGQQAIDFGIRAYLSVMGEAALDRLQIVKAMIEQAAQGNIEGLTHAYVTELVLSLIKEHGWGLDKLKTSANTA